MGVLKCTSKMAGELQEDAEGLCSAGYFELAQAGVPIKLPEG